MSHVPGKLARPARGAYTEQEYLALNSNCLIEFSHGWLEELPGPTTSHQLLVAYLYGCLLAFVSRRDLGTVLFAPLRVRLWRGKFREPDLVFMLKEHRDRIRDDYWVGTDLAMEVVSDEEEDRRRDLETKWLEYARAAISEYWIIDPRQECIMVLRLAGKHYVVHGEFTKGTVATSLLLPGFTVDVTTALSQQVATPKTSRKEKRPPQF
jgi:Uma2 family endonuclease